MSILQDCNLTMGLWTILKHITQGLALNLRYRSLPLDEFNIVCDRHYRLKSGSTKPSYITHWHGSPHCSGGSRWTRLSALRYIIQTWIQDNKTLRNLAKHARLELLPSLRRWSGLGTSVESHIVRAWRYACTESQASSGAELARVQ
jgi:hypothetical protein